jgi:hypothetical protein
MSLWGGTRGGSGSISSVFISLTSASPDTLLFPPRPTVYPTVYDNLSLWYRSGGMERKGLGNGHRADWETPRNGFRGRVSQVRILPG